MTECPDDLATRTLDAAFDVHRELGPGLLESVYESALAIALQERGIEFQRQVEIPTSFHGQPLGIGFRADMIVARCLLLEIKAVDSLLPVHLAQIMTYLKLLKFRHGYLLNLVHQTFLWVGSTLSRTVCKEDVRWTAWSCTDSCLG